MKNTKNTTAMQSISTQITETMKQSFIESRKVYTKDEILSHLKDFSSRKVKKAWLTKRINDRVVYLNFLKLASTEGWKHFYGQPIHQKFVELQMSTLQSMIEVRLKLSPESERESLLETFLGGFTNPQPKVASKVAPKPQPKVVEAKVQPKVVKTKSQPKVVEQPKVVKQDPQNEVLLELTKSVTALASQMASLTEMVQNNSKAIAELQKQPKVAEQPKVEKAKKQPKVVTTQPKVEAVKVVTPSQPKVAKKKQTKFVLGQMDLFNAWFTSKPAIKEKKSTISHEAAFEHSSDVEKSAWRKFRMEVK